MAESDVLTKSEPSETKRNEEHGKWSLSKDEGAGAGNKKNLEKLI